MGALGGRDASINILTEVSARMGEDDVKEDSYLRTLDLVRGNSAPVHQVL